MHSRSVRRFGRYMVNLCVAALAVLVIAGTPVSRAPLAFAQEHEDVRAATNDFVQHIIDNAEGSEDLRAAYERLVSNPISPPDTRSPRATLESFLVIVEAANDLWLKVREEYFDGDTFFMTQEQKKDLVLVEALLEKAARTFDLSAIPAASRARASIEIVLQMQEILDRIYLPPPDEIPGLRAAANAGPNEATGPLPDKWIIPGTSLTIELQKEGPRAGEYLFTEATVYQVPDDYDEVKALPIVSDRGEDLYQYYIYTPGNLVAPRWYEFILDGPNWLQRSLAGQAYWQWMALALVTVLFVVFLIAYARWSARRTVPLDPASRQSRRVLGPVLVILAANLFHYLCEEQINITGELLQLVTTAISAIIWTAAAWLTYQLLQTIYLLTIRNPNLGRASLDASLVRTGFRVASFVVAIIVLGYGATRIGIPIYGVVAGLGVGGLAIALAAQPTLENFISGLILYADRIVRVGDFFQFDDTAGTVEEIGIRSTRIRALDRTLIIVANADLVKRKITNFSQRDVFLFRHKIGLRYQTDTATLHRIMEAIRGALADHESVLESPRRVRLVEYGASAIVIDVYANIAAADINVFLAVQEELLLRIRDLVEEHGSGFAYPSSTLYLARDDMPEPKQGAGVAQEEGETQMPGPAGDETA